MSEYRKEELLATAHKLRKCEYLSIIDGYVLCDLDLKEVAEMIEEYASKKEIEPIK